MSQQHLLQDQLVQAVPAQLAGGLTCGAGAMALVGTIGSGMPDARPGVIRSGVNLDEEHAGTEQHEEAARAAKTARQGQPLQLTPASRAAQRLDLSSAAEAYAEGNAAMGGLSKQPLP